jgi:uncharacterized protein (DUF1015 family)
MKNTKFIPGASKAEEKVKGTKQKKKRNHFNFFHLDKFQPKRNQRISSENKEKWMKNLESLACC